MQDATDRICIYMYCQHIVDAYVRIVLSYTRRLTLHGLVGDKDKVEKSHYHYRYVCCIGYRSTNNLSSIKKARCQDSQRINCCNNYGLYRKITILITHIGYTFLFGIIAAVRSICRTFQMV